VDKLAGFVAGLIALKASVRDLHNSRLIYLKGVLFFIAAALAAACMLVRDPQLCTATLLAIAIWSSARFYYFVFYVTERYVDPHERFSGFIALARRLLQKRSR
jgi:hypothetical protein